MKWCIILLLGWLTQTTTQAQLTLTLEQCYAAALETAPLRRQLQLARQSGELQSDNLLQTRRLPQLAINGQATWQSEVTTLPIEVPNFTVPTLSKDQYKLTLDASYALFDGALLPLQQRVQQATTALTQQQTEVELNRLKDQVNGLYLNALLTDETIRQTGLVRKDLTDRMGKLAANVKFGTAAPMNADALEAEQLKTEQRLSELNTSRRGLRAALALLTGLPITDSTRLERPVVATETPVGQRPELKVFSLQQALADAQLQLVDNRRMPRLSAFVQTGFGRPALNFLSNDFRPFFIGGLRLNWNLGALYTLRNDKSLLGIQREQTDVQRAVFEKNLAMHLQQQQTEIDRIAGLIVDDGRLVALRQKIRRAAAVQLDNGVLAARDYISELNAENGAILNQSLHELQLVLARVQYRTLLGY